MTASVAQGLTVVQPFATVVIALHQRSPVQCTPRFSASELMTDSVRVTTSVTQAASVAALSAVVLLATAANRE